MLQLRNRFLPLLRATPTLYSLVDPRACRLLSTSTTIAPTDFSLEDYLIAACGLAQTQAREVSKKASRELSSIGSPSSRLKSASNPDAILALLSGAGLSRADIAAVVSADPLLLRASVKNIAPRLVALRDGVGLSAPQTARFLVVGSRALRNGDVVARLEFFISVFGSFEQVLVAAKRNSALLKASLERVIKPNIALIRRWGVRDIAQLCSNSPWVLSFNPERVKEVLLRAEELGVPPTSGMFRHAVAAVAGISKEKVAAKLDLFKRTLRCSESEVSTAVCKVPRILRFSDEILLRKIEFLVNEAAMEPRYIVERPVLLTLSLEKRLVPRHYVMKVLQEKGSLSTNMSFYTLASYGEKTFKSKFIDCHKDSVPGLADAFATTRAARQKWPWVLNFNLGDVQARVAFVACNSKEKVAAKLEFLKRTLGCSKSDVSTAVSKMPSILGLSDEILLRKIEFLVNKAAMEPRHILERPVLLAYSLEKRLVPRHYVMTVMQEKGLLSTNTSFKSIASYGVETFKSKFIDCPKDSVPGLADAYATACAGIVVPSRV